VASRKSSNRQLPAFGFEVDLKNFELAEHASGRSMNRAQFVGLDTKMALSTRSVDKSVEGRPMKTARCNGGGLAGALASF
jgi:hypothetical protein